MASIFSNENVNRIIARIRVQEYRSARPVIQCARCPRVIEDGQGKYIAGDSRLYCEGCVEDWVRGMEMD